MVWEVRSLDDTVVVVTGASSGIGRATSRALVAAGARVAITARRVDRLDSLVAELGSDSVVAYAGDIADPATSAGVVRAALDSFGRLDSLVAAAGLGLYGGVMDGSDDEVAEMIAANFTGTVWSVRAAVPHFAEGGDIVIVSSVAGIRGGGHEAAYAGTKAAQLVYGGAIDRELRERGIRAMTICPAAVHTEFAIGKGRSADDPWLDTVMVPEDVAGAIVTTLQQPRRLRTTQWAMWSSVEAS